MHSYRLAHADLFRAVAEILVRDYIAPSETAETVSGWLEPLPEHKRHIIEDMEPSELAALIADVEGYTRRQG